MEIAEALTVPAVVLALVWLTVEWAVPSAWAKSTKVEIAVALGVLCVVLLHHAALGSLGAPGLPPAAAYVTKVSYWGPGVGGYILAGVMGLLAGGLAPVWHEHIVNKYLPRLKKKGVKA